MQALTRWRNFFTSSSFQLASFRSTPIHLHKNKTNNNVRIEEKPSKDQIRFETRQKRADGKKALKSLLYNGGSPRSTIVQDDNRRNVASDYDYNYDYDYAYRRKRDKSLSDHRSKAEHQKRRERSKAEHHKRRERGNSSFSDYDDEFDGNSFRVSGGYKCCTWTFMGADGFWNEDAHDFFEWKQPPKHDNRHRRQKDWRNESDHESADEETTTPVENPSREERILLGLPPLGHITIAQVKNAFRLSALKWHPDKHQGPLQGIAEEKFKRCLDAYKHLCKIHSSPQA